MKFIKENWFKLIIVAGLLIIIIFVIIHKLSTPQIINGLIANDIKSDTENSYNPSDTSSNHISSYISSVVRVLNSLYFTTQEQINAENKYPTSDKLIQTMTASLAVHSDLSDAIFYLRQFLNDSDKAIQGSAGLLYADILKMKNINEVLNEEFRTATPETLNLQRMKYDIAQYAAAQDALQKDLFENNLIYIITKGLIQIPVEQNEAVGPIKYSLSLSQRQDLKSEIQTIFGTTLDNYNNNVYLLATKIIQLSLGFETYEEQKNYKFP